MPIKPFFVAVAFVVFLPALFVQQPAPEQEGVPASQVKPSETQSPPEPNQPREQSSSTDHTIRLGIQTIPYKATASTTLLKNNKGEPVASIFSVAYTRSDVGDLAQRPIAFLYNGGPGSSSAWLHMGAFGPRRVITENTAPTGAGPYKLIDNANCLLDKSDLVFIDPVGTGFSRVVGKGETKDYWGVDQDVRAFAEFIGTYLNRNGRWNSPKFLIGESYGTFRSVALANYLQSQQGIYVNGIALISTTLDMAILEPSLGDDRTYIFHLPSYAAAAWYYKTLKNRPNELASLLRDARQWASTDYAAALMKGDTLTEAERFQIAKRFSDFTGLDENYILKANLRVTLQQFRAELQRRSGVTVGRYDSRYSGPEYDLLAENAQDDPSFDAVSGAFTAAINDYVRRELKFTSELSYETLNGEVFPKWDWKHKGTNPFAVSVERDLVEALLTNPRLQVQAENGWFDMATPFFATEFAVNHLQLPENLRSHITFKYYDSGHMIYLNEQELPKLKDNIGSLIAATAKPQAGPKE